MTHKNYRQCIDACQECAIACNHCAVSCLQEKDVHHLLPCIQLDMECSAICEAAARVMSLEGKLAEQVCQLCADICTLCADECEKHAGMEHCKECAEMCRKCADLCMHMMAA